VSAASEESALGSGDGKHVLVFFRFLFHVSDFLRQLLEAVFVVGVL
jgi:hypothetical protein